MGCETDPISGESISPSSVRSEESSRIDRSRIAFEESAAAFATNAANRKPTVALDHISKLHPIWEEAREELFFGTDPVVLVPFTDNKQDVRSDQLNIYLAFSEDDEEQLHPSVIGLVNYKAFDRGAPLSGYVYTMDENLIVNRVLEVVDGKGQRIILDPTGEEYFGKLNSRGGIQKSCGPGDSSILAFFSRLFGSRVRCPTTGGGGRGIGSFFSGLFDSIGETMGGIFSGGGSAFNSSGLTPSDFWFFYGRIPSTGGGFTFAGGGGGGGGLPGAGDPGVPTNIIYSDLLNTPIGNDFAAIIGNYTVNRDNAVNLAAVANIFIANCIRRPENNHTELINLYACSITEILEFIDGNGGFKDESVLKLAFKARAVQMVTAGGIKTFNYLMNDRVLTLRVYSFLEFEGFSPAAVQTVRTFLLLKQQDARFRFDRFVELHDLLKADPDAWINNCDQRDIDPWNEVAGYVLSGDPLDRINSTDRWKVQEIGDARGSLVNLDYFAVQVETLPFKNGRSGARYTPKEMIDYFRLNINDFADKFTPDAGNDGYDDPAIWNSNSPLLAVLNIDLGPQVDGDVICSQYSNCCWVFTTLEESSVLGGGYHPVSGNRIFGYKVDNLTGDFILYTRGADRTTTLMHSTFWSSIAFFGADKFWREMQERFEAFVSDNGGTLSTSVPESSYEEIHRPEWDEIKARLMSLTPITNIRCN